MLDIVLLPPKLSVTPNPLELKILLEFFKRNGMRSNNQNFRDKVIVILKKSLYRFRNMY